MVVAILKSAFSSIENVRFVDTGKHGMGLALDTGDQKLGALASDATWRELCLGYLRKYGYRDYYLKQELRDCKEKVLEDAMDGDRAFFDEVAG
jgi:hypothetical protein